MTSNRSPGWTHTLRQEGPLFLAWLAESNALSKRFETIVAAMRKLISNDIRTRQNAQDVWTAVPAVRARCNENATYKLPGAPWAYAWLYLLERYVRTWQAMELLVENCCLPMGKYGVGVLDVGTGPGPSAFAIHDFYDAMVEYASANGKPDFQQPSRIECVESDRATNSLRHRLAEIVYELSENESGSVLALCKAFHDFGEVNPTKERQDEFRRLNNSEYEYYDETRGFDVSESMYTTDEANEMAQTLRRYRLFTFSNFLTTNNAIKCFRCNLKDIFSDARPGSVILTIGGTEGSYPAIYESLELLSASAGFRRIVEGRKVSSSTDAALAERVWEEENITFELIQSLAPDMNDCDLVESVKDLWILENMRKRYEGPRKRARNSQVRAYRKY